MIRIFLPIVVLCIVFIIVKFLYGYKEYIKVKKIFEKKYDESSVDEANKIIMKKVYNLKKNKKLNKDKNLQKLTAYIINETTLKQEEVIELWSNIHKKVVVYYY